MNSLPPFRPVVEPVHQHDGPHNHVDHSQADFSRSLSVLGWPAWRRVLFILPLVVALWLALWWANMGASPW